MKVFFGFGLILAFVVAEPPPSNSYLPPPPNRGYPQSQNPEPQIIAARTLAQGVDHTSGGNDHGAGVGESGVNGFTRNGQNQGSNGNHLGAQTRFGSQEGYDNNAASFAKNTLEDSNGTLNHEADERGFKPQTSQEDSEDLARSGYDSNANNFRANNGFHSNDHNSAHGSDHNGGHGSVRSGYN